MFILFFFLSQTFCSFICLVLADRSNENKKEFSIEELNAWNGQKLRTYLKNRGVVISCDTRKRDLVPKVYHARSFVFAYLAVPVLVIFHCQGTSNINCSITFFIFDVCRLSLPVSSATTLGARGFFFSCCLRRKLSGEAAIVTNGKKPSGHGSYGPHFHAILKQDSSPIRFFGGDLFVFVI